MTVKHLHDFMVNNDQLIFNINSLRDFGTYLGI